jgi:hypothetical protein
VHHNGSPSAYLAQNSEVQRSRVTNGLTMVVRLEAEFG